MPRRKQRMVIGWWNLDVSLNELLLHFLPQWSVPPSHGVQSRLIFVLSDRAH